MVKIFTLRCPVCGYEEVVEKLIYASKFCRKCKAALERTPHLSKCLHSERIHLNHGKTLCRPCRKVFDRDGKEISLEVFLSCKKVTAGLLN